MSLALFLLSLCGHAYAQYEGRVESNDGFQNKNKGATISAATAAAAGAAIMTPAASGFLTGISITGAGAPNTSQAHVFTTPLQGFPTNGADFLVLSSGRADLTPGVATTFESQNVGGPSLPGSDPFASPDGLNSLDVVTLKMTFMLPVGTNIKLGFDWKFGSEEVPQFETAFKDYFRADLFDASTAHIANIALLPNNNPVTAFNMISGGFCNSPGGNSVTPTPPFPVPNDVIYNAVTSAMGNASIDLSAYSGQAVTLLLRVADVNDGVLNSAAFIDNLDITYNQYPVAKCQNVTLNAGADCQAMAWPSQVDAGSYDPEGGPLTYSLSPAGPYPLGTTAVVLTVTDNMGASASCNATVTVVDVTPPTISVVLNPTTLWPPNHAMKTINATVTVSDNCPGTTWVLTSISSSEPDNGLGDGDQPNDIQDAAYGTADAQFKLRAERSGTGNGRVYTVTYTATDGSGNSASASATVSVPKSMGKPSLAGADIPAALTLEQNYPNPFNPTTLIKYGVPDNGNVLLELFDLNSRLVATLVDEAQQAGSYTLLFDASALPSGSYVARLSMNGSVVTRRMNLVK